MSGSSESPEDFSFNDLAQQPAERNGANPPQAGADASQDQEQAPKPKRIACVLCRKRKLRCDGARPTCGTCKRLKHDCAYDEVRRKSGPKRGYVKQLEARLQQVETLLKNQESTDQPRDASQTNSSFGSGSAHQALSDTPTIQIGNGDPMSNMFQPSGGISPGEQFMGQGASDGMGDEPFPWEMIGLGLDEPLPPQDEINELNQIYFAKVHPSVPIIHRPRYYAAMNLAPFMRPPVCLRYAMWALAASASDKYETLQQHFYERARKYAQLDEMRGHGESIITLGHCQAWVLLCTYEFKQMFFPRAWLSAGRAVRLSQMMMLHRLDGTGLDVKQCLPPPKDWTEREERRRAFWGCFCVDRYASIGTGWPMSIEEKDIQTNLPASEEAFDKSKPMPTPSLGEATMPTGISRISSFGGVCLMASCFGRNLTHLHRPTSDDREDDLNGEFWKRHRQMDNVLLSTLLALPEDLRMPLAMTDPNAIFFQMCLHTSAICLHQAAIFKADKNRLPVTVTNESKIRCMNAASEIASLMRMISHLDLASMNPFISFSIYVAARVFVQWLKNRPKDQQVISSLQFLLQAMHALKKRNPLTESFMVQLDLDLEGIGIPGLRTGVDHFTAKVTEIPTNYDPVGCSSLYEIRESQNPAPKPFGNQNLGIPNGNSVSPNSRTSGHSFQNPRSPIAMDIQNPATYGFVPQDGGDATSTPHSTQPNIKNMRGLIIPIIESTETSEMDTSPDTSVDQPTPASSVHRGSSSNTSFSPPGGQDDARSPNPQGSSAGVNGTTSVGMNIPSSTAPSQHPQNFFSGPTDDELASLAAQFYTGSPIGLHHPTTNSGTSFSLPVQSEWETAGNTGVSPGMSPLSANSWGMLDMASMGWDNVAPSSHGGEPPHWTDPPLRSR